MNRGAACAVALLVLASTSAPARDTLPWRDANPVGRSGEPAKPKPATKRAEVPKPEGAASSTVAAGAAASGSAPADVPVPEARPAATSGPASSEPASPAPEAETAKPEARPADDHKPNEPAASAGETSGAVMPPADEPPASDIPVPDERPTPTPAELASVQAPETPPSAPAAPPAATPEPTAPEPKPEEAPNSTEKLKSREPDVTPAATVEAAAAVEDSIACEAALKKRGVEFTVDETISEGECGVLRPVAVKRLSSGIAVSPKTQMLCRTTLALDDWMTKSVVPAAKSNLSAETLTEFRHASTYVCRPRASENGISEHARGSAIDIGSFVFKSGREIGIAAKAPNTPEETFLETVRTGACGPFKTVLGPGTDADHATHFHLDIAARKNGSIYCK